MSNTSPKISPVMRDLSGYIATARERDLPKEVAEKARGGGLVIVPRHV